MKKFLILAMSALMVFACGKKSSEKNSAVEKSNTQTQVAGKTYKIGVVGNRDAILPFRLIGFQTFPVTEATEAVNTLRRLSREDFAIIYLTEDMAAEIPETLAYYDKQVLPAIILIPTHKGVMGLGQRRIRENVEKAVGQDIL